MSLQSPPSAQRCLSDEASCPQGACDSSHLHGLPFQDPTKIGKSRPKAKKHHLKLLGSVESGTNTTLSTEIPFLLRLPGEVRNLIYSYALTSPDSTLTFNVSEMRFPLHDIGFGLMSSCHALALETQYLHMKLNKLVFEFDMESCEKTSDYITVLKNLRRLGDAKSWAIYAEFRVKKRNGDWAEWRGEAGEFLLNLLLRLFSRGNVSNILE